MQKKNLVLLLIILCVICVSVETVAKAVAFPTYNVGYSLAMLCFIAAIVIGFKNPPEQ